MFHTPHAIQWVRPEEQDGVQAADWFNILVLHQNRSPLPLSCLPLPHLSLLPSGSRSTIFDS